MKKNHWITVIAGIAIVLGIYAVPAAAQSTQQQGAGLPYYVAVIDVAQVIKLHPDFMERQAALKAQVESAEATFLKRQETIANKQKALEASPHKAGSPDHQRILDDIANDVADFEKDARAMQRRFALQNSQIMYDTYKDIKDTIGRYAQNAGIAQVTDYREFEPNPADPTTVAEDMDQRLVWFNKNLNITQYIIGEIYRVRNKPMPALTANAGTPGAPSAVGNPAAAPRTATPQPAPGMPAQR